MSKAESDRLVPPLAVLVDEDVWPEYQEAIKKVGTPWSAPSGRIYALNLLGSYLRVDLLLDELVPPPSNLEINTDLLELAILLQDNAGAPWSGDFLRQLSQAWGFPGTASPFEL